MLAIEREGVNERRDRSVPRGTLLHGENQGRVLSSSHRGTRCSSNTTGHQRRGTRCSLCGSCPFIAQRSRGTRCSWSGSCRRAAPSRGAFRRRSPADSPVGALARRGAQLGTTHSNCNGSKRRRSPAAWALGEKIIEVSISFGGGEGGGSGCEDRSGREGGRMLAGGAGTQAGRPPGDWLET